jgi:hypothetical protein
MRRLHRQHGTAPQSFLDLRQIVSTLKSKGVNIDWEIEPATKNDRVLMIQFLALAKAALRPLASQLTLHSGGYHEGGVANSTSQDLPHLTFRSGDGWQLVPGHEYHQLDNYTETRHLRGPRGQACGCLQFAWLCEKLISDRGVGCRTLCRVQ